MKTLFKRELPSVEILFVVIDISFDQSSPIITEFTLKRTPIDYSEEKCQTFIPDKESHSYILNFELTVFRISCGHITVPCCTEKSSNYKEL